MLGPQYAERGLKNANIFIDIPYQRSNEIYCVNENPKFIAIAEDRKT